MPAETAVALIHGPRGLPAPWGPPSLATSQKAAIELRIDRSAINPPSSVLGVALRGNLRTLLVAVVGTGNAPAIVVVVVQVEQVFYVPATWIDAMSVTQVALDFLDGWSPVTVHVPARTGDS